MKDCPAGASVARAIVLGLQDAEIEDAAIADVVVAHTLRGWSSARIARDLEIAVSRVQRIRVARKDTIAEALEQGRAALESAIPTAVAALEEIAQSATVRPSDRIAAAEAILDRVGLVKTTKIEAKVQSMPSSVEDMTAQLVALTKGEPQGEQG